MVLDSGLLIHIYCMTMQISFTPFPAAVIVPPTHVTTFLRVKFGRRREKRGVTRWWRAGGGLRITDS